MKVTVKEAVNANYNIKSSSTQYWLLLVLLAIIPRLFVQWNEDFGFRQTQVAITAYWFVRDGINLLYPQLPIFGPNGTTIPFEFPLFQGIVAATALLLKLNSPTQIIILCRFFNFLFFLACAPVLFRLAKRELSAPIAKTVVILWLTVPYIFFWSTESMIEFCAVFWTLLYADLLLQLLQTKPSMKQCLLAISAGTLAFCVKSTTTLCLLPSLILTMFYYSVKTTDNTKTSIFGLNVSLKRLGITSICLGIPFLIGYGWVMWSDFLKSQNTFAGIHLTSAALKNWNFGTISQRMDIATWQRIFTDHIGFQILAFIGIPFALLGAAKSLTKFKAFIWLLPIFMAIGIFTNLYFVHNYYYEAITPYCVLLLAIGIDCLVAWLPIPIKWLETIEPVTGFVLAITMWAILFTKTHPLREVRKDKVPYYVFSAFIHNAPLCLESKDILPVANIIKNHSEPDDWVEIMGADWSSEIPFYSGRKAIMLTSLATMKPTKDNAGTSQGNSQSWLAIRKVPAKLFVDLDWPYSSNPCAYVERNPQCTIAQTKTFWIGKCFRDNYDWIKTADLLITSAFKSNCRPKIELNNHSWQLVAPAPSKMNIIVPPTASICETTFGIRNDSEKHDDSSGIKFRLSLESPNEKILLWEKTLQPGRTGSDNEPQSTKISLPKIPQARLYFETITEGITTVKYLPYWSNIQIH